MINKQKKIILNFKILRLLFIAPFLVSIPFFTSTEGAKAGLEFQWDQGSGFKRLKWHQKENKRRFRNKIYFFLRPADRNNELLKINLVLPKKFQTKLTADDVSLCKVRIGGFDTRTKCLKNIPADVEIKKETSSIDIFPYNPVPSTKDSYAIVLKVNNPNKTGLFQFHSYGQPAGKSVSSYLGSWTIMID